MTHCRTCGAEVEWATSIKTGRPVPLEWVGLGEGNFRLLEDVAPKIAEYIKGGGYVSHFARCPQAQKWREWAARKRKEG